MRLSPWVAAILLIELMAYFPGVAIGRDARTSFTWMAAASENPTSPETVTRGMKKEQVRALWGEPVAVRKIRTCFGTQEEWVYRGDPQRYGGEERTLLFDEDEVLAEIK